MDIGNKKSPGLTYICMFPPEQNLNILSLTFLSGKFGFVKRNKFWIAFTLVGIYLGAAFIQYRLSMGEWEPISTPLNYEMGDILVLVGVALVVVIIAGLTFGRSAPSGTTRITRPTVESVDGFGGARARDFSYMPGGHSGKGGLPVSLRKERQRTATFREGAKDRVEDKKKKSTE